MQHVVTSIAYCAHCYKQMQFYHPAATRSPSQIVTVQHPYLFLFVILPYSSTYYALRTASTTLHRAPLHPFVHISIPITSCSYFSLFILFSHYTSTSVLSLYSSLSSLVLYQMRYMHSSFPPINHILYR